MTSESSSLQVPSCTFVFQTTSCLLSISVLIEIRDPLSINLAVLNLFDFLPDLVNNVDKTPANVSTFMQLHPLRNTSQNSPIPRPTVGISSQPQLWFPDPNFARPPRSEGTTDTIQLNDGEELVDRPVNTSDDWVAKVKFAPYHPNRTKAA